MHQGSRGRPRGPARDYREGGVREIITKRGQHKEIYTDGSSEGVRQREAETEVVGGVYRGSAGEGQQRKVSRGRSSEGGRRREVVSGRQQTEEEEEGGEGEEAGVSVNA